MPQPKKGRRFGGSGKHHNMIMANLATELFRHGRIKTTKSKAKAVQPLAERMITFAKRGDLHARRQVLTVIRDKDVVHKLFDDIGPAAADRNGGYTRVIPLGPRKGDNAEMAMIELVDITTAEETDLTEAPRRRWSLRRMAGNLSRSAREREEAILAAEDAGESTFVSDDADDEPEEALAAEQISERTLGRTDRADDDVEGPEVSPEDVAARLDEDAEDEETADEDVESEDESDD